MPLQKRSLTIKGHATSVRLEPEFWQVLEKAAAQQKLSLPALITKLDAEAMPSDGVRNLASQLRVYALQQALKREN